MRTAVDPLAIGNGKGNSSMKNCAQFPVCEALIDSVWNSSDGTPFAAHPSKKKVLIYISN
jgi:hypothetical protein